jgi:hypothetical protein
MQTPEEIKAYKRQWYLANKERTREHDLARQKAYKQANKEQIKAKSKEYHAKSKHVSKAYQEKNKERLKEYRKEFRAKNWEKVRQREREAQIRKRQDPFYKLKDALRNRIRASMKSKGYSKKSKTFEILGCSFESFKLHIESQFQSWMNWDNHGNPKDGKLEPNKTWDLDHIVPISSAVTEEDVIRLSHYTNFRPLCSYENRIIKRNLMI